MVKNSAVTNGIVVNMWKLKGKMVIYTLNRLWTLNYQPILSPSSFSIVISAEDQKKSEKFKKEEEEAKSR